MSEIEKYYNGEIHVDFEEIPIERKSWEELSQEIIEQHNEIERLHSIINEVREYITSHREAVDERGEHIIYFLKDDFDEEDILQILEKENK